jgi:AcrR family transcriptional regulator
MIVSMADVKRRPYRTTIRRGDAPALICTAAYRLFSDKGYVATSIEDIAAEAGVARPTIFTAVGPKSTILRLVVDQALAGDDAPVPIAQRPWWREAIDEPDPVRSIQLHARNMCLINQRAAPVLRALETAASVDAEAGDVWDRFQRQRHDGLNEVAVALRR